MSKLQIKIAKIILDVVAGFEDDKELDTLKAADEILKLVKEAPND